VLIHDLSAPGGTLERIAEARLAVPGARVLLLSHSMDAEWLNEAREAGIHAAIARDVAATSLATLVREIGSGTVFHAFAPPPASNGVAEMTDQLTARELQILRLVTSGASNSRIAAELWVTEQTVKFHLSNTYRKLGVANRTQAAHYAHLHGLLASTRGPDPAPAVSPTAVAA
jgi:DNA-binding NarL/FixJ family response regulator